MGRKVGQSLAEPDKVNVALAAIEKAKKKNVQFLLPVDNVIATAVPTGELNKKGKPVMDLQNPRVSAEPDIPDDAEGLDIGPETVKRYCEIVRKAKTVLWNGPTGLFEDRRFAEGTNAIAQAVAETTEKNGATSVIGGGDSVKAINQAGLGDKVTFMSTGGGASLEFLEGKTLPGVAVLQDK
jgi:phosphoglycerate kinase